MEIDFPQTLKKCRSTQDFDEQDSFSTKVRKSIKVSLKNPFASFKVLSLNCTEPDSRSELRTLGTARSFESVPDHSSFQESNCLVDPCYFIPQKHLKHLLGFPCRVEVKLKTSKLSFKSLIELARQQVYLMLAEEAFYSLSKAKKLSDDPVSSIWEGFVSLKYPKVVKEDRSGCCSKRKKVNFESKYLKIYEKIEKLPNCLEKNLLMLEMALNEFVQVGSIIEPWQFYARQALLLDKYSGYLAFGSGFLKTDAVKGVDLLSKLVFHYPSNPEAYLVLWNFFYSQKDYLKALNIIEKGYFQINSVFFASFSNLFLINLTKTLFRLKRFKTALEVHMKNYLKSKNNLFYLFLFGKSCIKSKIKNFQSAGLSALKEVLRWIKDFPRINFWYARACFKSKKLLKAKKHFQKVILSLTRTQVKYSVKIQNMLGKIETEMKNLSVFKQVIQQNPASYSALKAHEKLTSLQKLVIAENLVKKGSHSKALEILQNLKNFESFSLIYFKIVPSLPFVTSRALLVNKLDSMHKSSKVPLFEFVEACCLYSDFLSRFQLVEASLVILKRLLIFYPEFESSLEYVKLEKSFWESMHSIRVNSAVFNTMKKKELVMKAVLSSLSSDVDSIQSPHLSKKKSSSVRLRAETSSVSLAASSQSELIHSIKTFGVYTDGGILLQISSNLESQTSKKSEQVKCLESYMQIMRKSKNKSKVESKLESLIK